MRHRTLIVTAAALAFVLAGSSIASADTGDAGDSPETRTERVTDRHRDRDRPTDRPTDRPHRDDIRPIWKRCLDAAHNDTVVDDAAPEFRKICRRLLWHRNAWKRCVAWAAEHPDVDVANRRELWQLCHGLG